MHVAPALMITCASCKACCCKLEVILMGEDDPPAEYIATDQWGGQVMKRLEDGWCAAVDRMTMRCRIYERRPGVCRDFAVGGNECLTERRTLNVSTQHGGTEDTEGTEKSRERRK
jgi:Fe-S-cluster containining protein